MGVMIRESPYPLGGVYVPEYFPVPQSTLAGRQNRPGLGQDEWAVDPKLLLGGVGLLALMMFVLGGQAEPKLRARKKRKLEAKAAAIRKKLAKLEAEGSFA